MPDSSREGVPTRYVGVYILDNPYNIDQLYHYYIPCEESGFPSQDVRPGAFVTVPFGRGNRKRLALVAHVGTEELLAELPPSVDTRKLKPLLGVCHERLFLSDRQIELCYYLKETTLCTIGEAVRTVVPAPALASLMEYYRPTAKEVSGPPESDAPQKRLSTQELLVYEYIQARKGASLSSLRGHFGAQVAETVESLLTKGMLEKELTVRQPQEAIKTETYYTLACPPAEVHAALRGEKGAMRLPSPHQRKLLEAVLAAGGRISAAALRESTGLGTAYCKSLLQRRILCAEEVPPERGEQRGTQTPFTLSPEQAAAVSTLTALAESGQPKAALLHGVTGSGKTCVILSMIDHMLAHGRGVLVLLPEISLTPQMLSLFSARYGEQVAVIHSGLSTGERLLSYQRIRDGQAPVVVGTRSAVFAPVPQLGMIVMDEEQEHTYKSDMNPKYHARDIARFRCASDAALLLLASATPSLESYRKAEEGKYTLITMKQRYGTAQLPRVSIQDMRTQPQSGNTSPLGPALVAEMQRVHAEGNQTVLFINRRGYSTQVVCRSCGKAITCPHCSVAMNYHTLHATYTEGQLVCHWCGTRRPLPQSCPECGSVHLMRMGYGTQRVEQELAQQVPGTRVMRMDADTTGTKSAYHELLGGFRRHEADILLGTQMVTKGHDFPDVTLVGVLLADMSLYVDDYRANERTFSLLTQVIGRAGRADKPGLAVIQTMNPDSDIIRLACAQDYERFYAQEIKLRRLLVFPPFCDMVLLTLTSSDEKELQKASLLMANYIRDPLTAEFPDVPLQAFGPFEAPVYRVDNVYRMRMVIKCRLNKRSRQLFSSLLVRFSSDPDISSARSHPSLSIDFNPSSL